MRAPHVAVAISGGIDSLVAALLLKNDGHRITGIHFITGYEKAPTAHPLSGDHADLDGQPRQEAISDMASALGIPVRFVDVSGMFQRVVVDYFRESYQCGRTPNPCMVCNPQIKFGRLLETAGALGAEQLATGHYARIRRAEDGHCALYRGIDRHKDQSYFLARLSRRQLQHARLPLGDKTKAEVRRLATHAGVRPIMSEDSQDICFLRSHQHYGEFLRAQPGFIPRPGPIVDTTDRVLGTHDGLHRYTIGQRRGINCPSSEPYYVVAKKLQGNRLVVGGKDHLRTDRCSVSDINWIIDPPESPLDVHVQVRYRSPSAGAVVVPDGRRRARVRFNQPIEAVAPGQGAVFYRGDRVLGGGWIDAPGRPALDGSP